MDILFFYNSRILEGKKRKNIIDNFLYFLYNWDLSALSLALKFFCCNTIPFQSSLSTIKLSFKYKCIVHCGIQKSDFKNVQKKINEDIFVGFSPTVQSECKQKVLCKKAPKNLA